MATTYVLNSSTNPAIVQDSIVPASLRDAFSEWLSDGNAKKFSLQVSLSCLDKISEYVKSKKISCSIWEISQPSAFKPVYQKVMDAKLLRIMERNTYKAFTVVGQMYMKFLKEKPWETTVADESTMPIVSFCAAQNENKNLTKVRSNDESFDSNVVPIIEDYDFKLVDKRDLGGALWVIGGLELSDAMEEIAIRGFHFKFKADGGRSSDYQSAWWYKPADVAEVSKTVTSEITQNESEQIQRNDVFSDERNGLKVGLYIRNKLRQLSESGFVFSEQQLQDICDLDWGLATFKLATRR